MAPLKGIRIVDLTRGRTGRLAVTHLVDQGARAIRINGPPDVEPMDAILARGRPSATVSASRWKRWVRGCDVVVDDGVLDALSAARCGRMALARHSWQMHEYSGQGLLEDKLNEQPNVKCRDRGAQEGPGSCPEGVQASPGSALITRGELRGVQKDPREVQEVSRKSGAQP